MQAIDFFHIIPWIVNQSPFIQPSPGQPFSFTGLESIVTLIQNGDRIGGTIIELN
jgi:hypothetical protein